MSFYHCSQKIGHYVLTQECADELKEDGYKEVFWFNSEDGGGLKFENFVNNMIKWLEEQAFDGWVAYQEVDHEVVDYSYTIFLKDESEILAFHLAWYGDFVLNLFPYKNMRSI